MVMGALDNGTHPITKDGLGKEFPCHSYRRVGWIWGAFGSAAIFSLSNQTTDNNLHILDLYTEKREQNDEPKRKKNVNAFSMVSWKLWRSIKIEWLDPFIDVLTCNFFYPAFIGTATRLKIETRDDTSSRVSSCKRERRGQGECDDKIRRQVESDLEENVLSARKGKNFANK